MTPRPPRSTLFPYTTLFRSASGAAGISPPVDSVFTDFNDEDGLKEASKLSRGFGFQGRLVIHPKQIRSEEHTSELQSRGHLVCRLLLEKKKNKTRETIPL